MLNSSHRHMLLLLVSIVTVIVMLVVTLNGSLGKKIARILILLHLTVSVTSTQSDRQTLRQTATYLCTGTHTHIQLPHNMCIHWYRLCTHICMHTHMLAHAPTQTHTHTFTCMPYHTSGNNVHMNYTLYAHMYACARAHSLTCARMHAHTHTHTQTHNTDSQNPEVPDCIACYLLDCGVFQILEAGMVTQMMMTQITKIRCWQAHWPTCRNWKKNSMFTGSQVRI